MNESLSSADKYTGRRLLYRFGRKRHGVTPFTRRSRSLAEAIRAFRVGASFPHSYSSAPTGAFDLDPHTRGDWLSQPAFTGSEPGATVPVFVLDGMKKVTYQGGETGLVDNWVLVANIPPTGEEVADVTKLLPGGLITATSSTDLAISTPAGVDSLSAVDSRRYQVAMRQLDLAHKARELDLLQRELRAEMALLEKQVKRMLDQIWAIELFIGSNEVVKCIAQGAPAPPTARISVRQRVLCMDEEIAVHDWLRNPDRLGNFGAEHLADFDKWVVQPSVLAQILPHEKGVVALKVRREGRVRDRHTWTFEVEDPDDMTYLLVKNGENVYRLWVDVRLWPRFFPRASEFDWLQTRAEAGYLTDTDREAAAEKHKNFIAGLVVVQGLVERSDLFAPLPPGVDVFNYETFDEHFDAIRDDEPGLAQITDGADPQAHWDWPRYKKWLASMTASGVRVLWEGRADEWSLRRGESFAQQRTGLKSVRDVPCPDTPHILTNDNGFLSIKYLPADPVYKQGMWGEVCVARTRKVSWSVFQDEIVPVDFLSWRLLERMIQDRAQREDHRSLIFTAFKFWAFAKRQAIRDDPFVSLVLSQAKRDPTDDKARAHVERLVRWWRMKTKQHRSLTADEPKALRMVLKALKNGVDFENDPEIALWGAQ